MPLIVWQSLASEFAPPPSCGLVSWSKTIVSSIMVGIIAIYELIVSDFLKQIARTLILSLSILAHQVSRPGFAGLVTMFAIVGDARAEEVPHKNCFFFAAITFILIFC